MRKVAFVAALVALMASATVAQTLPQFRWATGFNQWVIAGQAPSTYTFTSPSICQIANLYNGSTFTFATNAAVYVQDLGTSTNSELVTPSTVVTNPCGFTATFAHNHGSFLLKSGTAGLQEAINASVDGSASYPNVVLVGSQFYSDAVSIGTTAAALFAAASGSTKVNVVDVTTSPWTVYAWNSTSSKYAVAQLSNSIALSGTSPTATRAVVGSITTGSSTISGSGTNSFAGVRGLLTATPAQTLSSGFWYGTQGKLVLDGATLAIGSNHSAGVYAQVSANATTFTSGHNAIVIASGQTLPATSDFDGMYFESGGNAVNSVIKTIFDANFVFDLDYADGAGAAAMSLSGGTCNTPAGYLKLKVHGSTRYILLCTTVS